MANLVRLSKFLSMVLRHKSAKFGLELDAQGFTDIAAVWDVIQAQYGERYTRADLDAIVAGEQDGKQRFEVVDGRMRALYGHSRVRPISYPTVEPPVVLYHGTHEAALPAIRRKGLQSMQRQYVHLSTTVERAREVATRRTPEPIILRVRALAAYQAGVAFHSPEALHYLAAAIPPAYIDFPGD